MTTERPEIIFWKTSTGHTLVSMPWRPATAPTIPAKNERQWCRPWIPFGVVAWATLPGMDWRPMDTLPREWGLRRPEAKAAHVADDDDTELERRLADEIMREKKRKYRQHSLREKYHAVATPRAGQAGSGS